MLWWKKREGNGLLFRRNRFLDLSGGRFSQEDPIGLAGGMNAYGYAGGDPVNFSDPFGLCPPEDNNTDDCQSDPKGGCRAAYCHGYASGDPVNFSDPFGLCEEKLRDANGRCPGGITVAEWQAVERAAGRLSGEANARVRSLLVQGRIRGGRLSKSNAAETKWAGDDEVVLNRSTEGGVSAFDYGEDLTYLLAHESQHVAQAEGESRWTRWWMQLFYHAVPSFKRAFEADAVTYGCRNADVGAGYARRCRP